jgi:hypothetical protein
MTDAERSRRRRAKARYGARDGEAIGGLGSGRDGWRGTIERCQVINVNDLHRRARHPIKIIFVIGTDVMGRLKRFRALQLGVWSRGISDLAALPSRA